MEESAYPRRINLLDLDFGVFCPVCHNLSRHDHGPAPADIGEINQYHDNLFEDKDSDFQFHILRRPGLPPSNWDDESSCSVCAIILACVEHALSTCTTRKPLDEWSRWQVVVYLLPDFNAVLNIFPEMSDFTKSRRYELYVVEPDVYPFLDLDTPSIEPPTVCDAESLEFVRQCLRECQKSHPLCGKAADEDMLPTYLLHIVSSDSTVVLKRTQGLLQPVPYVALSHCWGELQTVRTTAKTLMQHMKGLEQRTLPILFQNAIRVARDCAVEYIWIDSLCIVQDDAAAWAFESSNMGNIYAHAIFTIAADRAIDGSVAILGADVHNDPPIMMFDVPTGDRSTVIRVRMIDNESSKNNTDGYLKRRAWPYQEAVLSRRLVQFTSRELVWRCSTHSRCQCRVHPGPTRHGDGVSCRNWRWHVENYSRRSLTYFSDRLPALSGLAAMVLKRNPSIAKSHSYLAGMWFGDPGVELSWFVQVHMASGKAFAPVDGENPAPSWSWASLSISVCWYPHDEQVGNGPELVEHTVAPATINPFGTVKRGSGLKLRAKTFDIRIGLNILAENDGQYAVMYEIPGVGLQKRFIRPDCTLLPAPNLRNSGQWTARRAESQTEADSVRGAKWSDPDVWVTCMLLLTTDTEGAALLLDHNAIDTIGQRRLGRVDWSLIHDDSTWAEYVLKQFARAEAREVMLV